MPRGLSGLRAISPGLCRSSSTASDCVWAEPFRKSLLVMRVLIWLCAAAEEAAYSYDRGTKGSQILENARIQVYAYMSMKPLRQ